MADGGDGRLTEWQRTNVEMAAEYLRSIVDQTPGDVRARIAYESLMELLDPARIVGADRRAGSDRRKVNLGPPNGFERRSGDRRSGIDRRMS